MIENIPHNWPEVMLCRCDECGMWFWNTLDFKAHQTTEHWKPGG